MKTRLSSLLLCLLAASAAHAAVAKLNAYYIGNSLTDNTKYDGVAASAKSAGVTFTWGRHSIPGAPLEWLWEHRTEGFCEPSCPPTALTTLSWDALTMQIGQRGLPADSTAACNFLGLARQGNANVQPYIYAVWPNKSWGDYATQWAKTYDGGWNNNWATKDYFTKLIAALRKGNPTGKPFLLVPSGHVMAELDRKIKAGQVAGVSSVFNWYEDDCHLNNVGAYVTGCTMFATICKADPRGLAVPAAYGTINATLARTIQETVWQVITSMSAVTGVTGGTSVDRLVPMARQAMATHDAAVAYTLTGRTASRAGWTVGAVLVRTAAGIKIASSNVR